MERERPTRLLWSAHVHERDKDWNRKTIKKRQSEFWIVILIELDVRWDDMSCENFTNTALAAIVLRTSAVSHLTIFVSQNSLNKTHCRHIVPERKDEGGQASQWFAQIQCLAWLARIMKADDVWIIPLPKCTRRMLPWVAGSVCVGFSCYLFLCS